MSPSTQKPLTANGKRWVWGLLISMGVVVAVNLLMVKLAYDSQPDLVESYQIEANRK